MKKILLIFFIFVSILITFSFTLFAQGVPPILEQLQGGEVLMDPGAGTVCFNSKRNDLVAGQLKTKPDEVEMVTITGNCPFDSGCDLLRVDGGGALNYVLSGAPETPTEEDYVNLNYLLPSENLPKGNVNITIPQEGLSGHNLYFYYGRGTLDSIPLPTEELGQGGENGQASTQQIGIINTFSFTGGEIPEGTQQSCTFVAWDPFGRVFDSVSLEPIPNIKVTLINDITKNPAVQRFEKNNDTTLADGLFNILVENEGIYQLSLENLTTHEFIDNPSLNNDYSKIYYDIYHPGDVFEEKTGIATHHDIPLQPIGSPYIAPKVEIMKMESTINMGSSSLYKGRVSHPFAKVCLVGETTQKEFGCTQNSDKYGVFQIIIENDKIPNGEKLTPIGYKVDLDLVSVTKKVQQTLRVDSLEEIDKKNKTVIGYEPVFSHLEGFAYDDQGIITPNAKIDIILKSVNKIAYTTYADSKGFFVIYSKNIPIMDYFIQIIPSGSSSAIHYSTSEFAKINKDYLTSGKLNLLTATKNNQLIVNPKTGKLNNLNSDNFNSLKNNPSSGLTLKNNSGLKFFLIVFILIILVLASFGIILYIKRT